MTGSLVLQAFPRTLKVFKGFKTSKESLKVIEVCPRRPKHKNYFPENGHLWLAKRFPVSSHLCRFR
jgi:hypothetical protein